MTSDTRSRPASRHALVTGGARRIGRAICEALAADGWTVGIHYRESDADAEALRAGIEAAGCRAYTAAADLADPDGPSALLAAAMAEGGPVTCLVNNASLFERDDIATVTPGGWEAHMAVNARAPLFLSQGMAAALPDGVAGNIVNIVDQRALNLPPGFVSYTASKAALWALTRQLALALAPRIRVNAIGPGPTLPSPRQSEAQFAAQAARVPLGHGAGAEEIADGVRYILSAGSMTGQMIALDGGQHLGWDTPDPGSLPVEE